MNILDENVPESQRQLLRSWRIRVSQIGDDVGRKGMKDEAIIPLLHSFEVQLFSPGISDSILAAYAMPITV